MDRDRLPGIGFVWHFPFVDVGTDQIPAVGPDAMVARAAWSALEPEEGRFDFASLDRQLAAARRGGFRLLLLLEVNAFCAPPWVARRVGAAGESARDLRDRVEGLGPHGEIPRADAPVFLRLQDAFLRALIGAVVARDPQGTVAAYLPGIEWWFPYTWRHAPADLTRFQAWLRVRHRRIDALNRAWGTRYARFGDAVPPRWDVVDLYRKGRRGLARLAAYGPPPPIANPAAAAADVARFWEETAARTIDALCARVKALDPTRPTVCWLTNAYAAGAEWDIVSWSSVRIDEAVRRGRAVDVVGLQLPASYGDPCRIGIGLDTARKSGKPLCALDLMDFSRGSAAGFAPLLRATHTAIAHGASSLHYCAWNGAKDFGFFPDWPVADLRRMVDEGRAALAWTRGMRPRARTAIVNPYLAASPWLDPGAPHSFLGWYRLLGRAGETVDVLTARDLAADPALARRYAVVVLPDAPVMEAEAVAALRGARRLLRVGRAPACDPYGRPLPHALEPDATLPDWGAAWIGDPTRENDAGDTPPLFVLPQDGADDAVRALREALRACGVPALPFALDGVERADRTDFAQGDLRGIYLVHRGGAPIAGATLRPGRRRVRAWIDGGERDLPVRGGVAAIPSFARAAILKIG